MITKDRILQLIERLPHSESRVPYTYHHDYVRMRTYAGCSRSQIADLKCWNEEELYACALIQLLTELGPSAFAHIISIDDINVIKECTEICIEYIKKLEGQRWKN